MKSSLISLQPKLRQISLACNSHIVNPHAQVGPVNDPPTAFVIPKIMLIDRISVSTKDASSMTLTYFVIRAYTTKRKLTLSSLCRAAGTMATTPMASTITKHIAAPTAAVTIHKRFLHECQREIVRCESGNVSSESVLRYRRHLWREIDGAHF